MKNWKKYVAGALILCLVLCGASALAEGKGTPGKPGGGNGGSSAPSAYTAAYEIADSATATSYASAADGENVIWIHEGDVALSDITVEKTGDSSGDSADFYGINAAVLVSDGATVTIDGAEIITDGAHANGVFSYGTDTVVNVANSTITTTGNNSGGLMTTGGGTMHAENVTVNTSGNSSAAIRSDRGGGTVTVEGGSYTSQGVGSPAIYSTAEITVSDAEITATTSEAVVIEGGNSVTLNNVAATGNNAQKNGQSTVKTNVLIYQSMSGDAAGGSSVFTMNGGSMTAGTGAMFHVTNVTTTINLTGIAFTYAADSDVFLDAAADAWGSSGKNGGQVTLNAAAQELVGNMLVDDVSSLSLNLTEGSMYTGAINPEGAAGTVTVTLDATSTWTLTGDSYIDALNGDSANVNMNGYTLYVGGIAVS